MTDYSSPHPHWASILSPPSPDYSFWAWVFSTMRILRYLTDNLQLSYYLKNKKITAVFSNHNEKDLWSSLQHPYYTKPSIMFFLFYRKSLSPVYSGFEVFHFLDGSFSLLLYPILSSLILKKFQGSVS